MPTDDCTYRTGLRLTGIVASSRKYATREGRAVHELLLHQEPSTNVAHLPALARREWGTDPVSHQVAERLARQYREGQLVTVTATGWVLDAKRQLLVLRGVDHAELAHAAPHITEPAHA